MRRLALSTLLLAPCSWLALGSWAQDGAKPIKILFLGDNGHHRPAERFRQLEPILQKRGIELVYTDKVDALNPKVLSGYDGLLVYANTTKISQDQEKALLDFVESGKGFIPLHCASACFLNSPKYVELVGAQFKRHGIGTFRTQLAEPEHPIMKGFSGFESFDETYVHVRHNEKDRTVLEYRVDSEGKEPWTWVRTHGKGRVFYTAWGHDARTWGNPGFQELVERGIRWTTGRNVESVAQSVERKSKDPAPSAQRSALHAFTTWDQPFPIPETTAKRKDVKPFEYTDVGKNIPNYKNKGQGHLSQMQLPLPAEESVKHMVVPKGFRVELFASDPDIRRPLCMNWDERGRLWIAESIDYPNELGKGRDRLVICEDTNGDNKADKFTVFAEGLSIPTGILFSHGGVLVFEGGKTVFLKDTNGDDKADVREELFSGWGMRDTHGCVSNIHYGLDNWIWAMQGYNQSRVQVGGESHEFRQGFFRFRLGDQAKTATKLEFMRSTSNNTWGLGFTEDGLVFGSTANGNPSVQMPIANRYYEMVKGWTPSLVLRPIADNFRFQPATDKVRQVDFFGGYTAAAGHAVYTARNYPKEYWDRTAFVCEPTGHLVGTFVLRREGAQFRSRNPFNLVASDDEWTSPIMAEVGPDGNVWMIDWYNYIVQHNPTPQGFKTGRGAAYESDLRDKKHGRIYRIVYDGKAEGGRQKAELKTLAGAGPDNLVAALKNDNMFWRKQAQRLLVERGKKDVVPGLLALAKDDGVDEVGLNVGAIHALWTLHGLGVLDGSNGEATQIAESALRHRSPGVRRNALQVLPANNKSVEAILAANALDDPEPLVRLSALLALADLPPNARAGQAIVDALARPANAGDKVLPDAATSAAARNSEHFLRALAKRMAPDAQLLSAAAIVAEHYAKTGPAESVGGLIAGLTAAEPTIADTIVRGLAKSWTGKTPTLNNQLEADLDQILKRLPPERRGTLIKLASAWGSKRFDQLVAESVQSLQARVRNEALKPEERVSAARELLGHRAGDKETISLVLDLITPRTPHDLAVELLGALRVSEATETGTLVLNRLSSFTPAVRSAGLGLLLSRAEWTRLFLEAAEKGAVQVTELSLDQKQSLTDHPSPKVKFRAQALLRSKGALPNADRQKVFDELLVLTKEKGDAVAGKAIYKAQCAKCHVHSGDGTRVGPDLTGVAVHNKEHILTDIIDPSRSVEGNFRVYTVTTTKGIVYSGLLAAESKTAIELFDAEGKKISLLRENIDEIKASPKSLMPDGFEKQVSRKDLTDLLEFLTLRGKYLPVSLDRVATVISTRGMFNGEEVKGERMVMADWKPREFEGIPFHFVDPDGDRTPNVIMLYGPQGKIPPKMPKTVTIPCNASAKAIHFLSGVSGWGFPYSEKGSVCMIVRLHYEDGTSEDHPLKNGEHFADYIRRVDVPGSKFAFDLRGKQIRHLAVHPQKETRIERVELVKGTDTTAPVVMAVTVELKN